jgi:hypothetical protein
LTFTLRYEYPTAADAPYAIESTDITCTYLCAVETATLSPLSAKSFTYELGSVMVPLSFEVHRSPECPVNGTIGVLSNF